MSHAVGENRTAPKRQPRQCVARFRGPVFGACAKIRSSNAPDSRSGCQHLVGWERRPHTKSLKSPIRMARSSNHASHSFTFSRWSRENGLCMLAIEITRVLSRIFIDTFFIGLWK